MNQSLPSFKDPSPYTTLTVSNPLSGITAEHKLMSNNFTVIYELQRHYFSLHAQDLNNVVINNVVITERHQCGHEHK